MAVERLPFELAKPSNDTFVTKTSEIGHNGEPLDQALGDLSKLDNIDKESTQSEEQALVFETDGGTQVGKIDPTGADFTNLKRGGQQVARMSDLPTKDTSIGDTPSTTNVPTTKAVKDYVDAHSGGDYPIDTETTSSEDEEQVWGNDAGTQEYVKVGSYGMKSKAYLDMQGNSIIEGEIGNSPSTTHAPSVKAVKDYVDEHGGGNLPISEETTQSEDEEIVFSNNAETDTYAKVGPYGIKAKAYLDINGNPIGGGDGNVLYGKKWVVCGDSFSANINFNGWQSNTDSIRKIQDGKYAGKSTVYSYLIGNRNNMTIVNEAISGSIMALDKTHVADPDHVPANTKNPFSLNRYLAVPHDADYLTLWFGINDAGNTNIGIISDTDNTTFYGAWNVVLDYFLRYMPFTKIGLVITDVCSATYRNAVIDIAKKWGLAYLDMHDLQTPFVLSRNSDSGMSSDAQYYRQMHFRVSTYIKCTESHSNSALNNGKWINPIWVSGSAYSIGDMAVYQNVMWKCITANEDVEWNESKWKLMIWKAGESYALGDIVNKNDRAYKCIEANNDSSFVSEKWEDIVYVAGGSYNQGDIAFNIDFHPNPYTHIYQSYFIEDFLRRL